MGEHGKELVVQGQAAVSVDDASLLNEAGSQIEGKKEKKVIRVAGARMVHEGDGLFVPSHSLRDILSTGGTIVPTSGVTLKVDGQPRVGPEVASVPGRMSEKEYKGRRAKADGSRPMSSAVPEGDPSLLLGAQAFGGDSVDQPPLNPDLTQQTQMRQELQYKIPDVDPLEGGRMRGILEKSSVEPGAVDPSSVDDGTYEEAIDTSEGKGFAGFPWQEPASATVFSRHYTYGYTQGQGPAPQPEEAIPAHEAACPASWPSVFFSQGAERDAKPNRYAYWRWCTIPTRQCQLRITQPSYGCRLSGLTKWQGGSDAHQGQDQEREASHRQADLLEEAMLSSPCLPCVA